MIKLCNSVFESYIQGKEKVNFPKFFENRFRVKDSPFSRRQINVMSNTGLIDDSREEGQKYHYFTFKEIIYLLLVKELKRFSFEIDQLLDLKDTFFKKVPKNDVNDKSNKNNSEIAISLVLMHVQIFLVIDSNFKAYFIDLSNLSDIINQNYSLHCLDFNELINKHLESLNIEMVEPEIKTLDNLYFEVAKQSKKT